MAAEGMLYTLIIITITLTKEGRKKKERKEEKKERKGEKERNSQNIVKQL